jgi:hypothetical protein
MSMAKSRRIEPWPIKIARRDAWVLPLLFPLALSPVVAGFITIEALAPGTPWPEPFPSLLPLVGPFSSFLAVTMLVLAVVMSVSTRVFDPEGRRRKRWLLLGIAALSSLGYQLWPSQYSQSQGEAFTHIENDSRLVESLGAFREEKGHYPDLLDELVPDYLASVPTPGLAGYPRFIYRREGEDFILSVPFQTWAEMNGDLSYRSIPKNVLKADFWRYGRWRFESSPNPRDVIKEVVCPHHRNPPSNASVR